MTSDGWADVERTAVEPSGPEGAPQLVDVGPEIGRYLVIDEIGQGGMGRVFRAYDPRLGREVALKRLHLRSRGDDNDRARMIREAKSMALVSHPNVVAVYDVDVDQGALFIAMEYVRGPTLAEWMRRRAPWREVVAMFVQAGRGLAAAHAQGIVHRDFKPTNVMVGDDGRPRVMDFGLARASQAGPEGEAHDVMPPGLAGEPGQDPLGAGAGESGNLGATLTALGTVVGTPAYMAPEQHIGEAVDVRTDQYAFCVAMWEALHGARPFIARDAAALAATKLRGPPSTPAGSTVPAALTAVLHRGLEPQPEARWPDMPALLSAIERVVAPARRRWPAAAVVVGAGGAIAFAAWTARANPCDTGGEVIEQTWDAEARARVEEQLLATGASFAGSTAQRVLAALDGYAARWTEVHREACEATHVRRTQSDEALDLRMACLRAHQQAVASAVELLEAADAAVLEQAIDIVGALPPLDRCSDLPALRERAPTEQDDELRERVAELDGQLEQAHILARAGRLDAALEMTQAVATDVAARDFEPLRLTAEISSASILSSLRRREEARPLLENAFDAALAGGQSRIAAGAALELVALLEDEGVRADTTVWLARTALGLAESDGTDPQLTSQALLHYGKTFAERELELEAEPYFRAAIERLEEALGPDHPDLIGPLLSNASLLETLDRGLEARALSERALALAEQSFGADHPRVAEALQQLAWFHLGHGDFEASLAAMDRSLAIAEAAFGRDHRSVTARLAMRAAPLAELERFPEAIASAEEALRRMDENLPELHASRASSMHNLAQIVALSGDHARAVELFVDVVRLRRAIGHKTTLLASLTRLGGEQLAVGRLEEAEATLSEALALDLEIHADDRVYDGYVDIDLANVLEKKGGRARAMEVLEAAIVRCANHPSRSVRASLALALAKLLWADESGRRRAVEMVERGLTELESTPEEVHEPRNEQVLAELRAWLDQHVIPSSEDPFARRAAAPAP